MYIFFRNFFSGWFFPALLISIVLCFDILLIAIFLIPKESVFSNFAQEFKIWCLGYDPTTQSYQWIWLFTYIIQSIFFISIALFLWHEPLKIISKQKIMKLSYPLFLGMLIIIIFIFSLLDFSTSIEVKDLAFIPEKLRTQIPLPNFQLIDQNKIEFSSYQEKDKILLITAIYSTCGYTCPTILKDVKDMVRQLSNDEKKMLKVIVISLDPEHDTPEKMKELETIHSLEKISKDTFILLSGKNDDVQNALDLLNISRRKNAETGIIDHANLFLLVDQQKKIAFRFTLGKQQKQWLIKASKLLISELQKKYS